MAALMVLLAAVAAPAADEWYEAAAVPGGAATARLRVRVGAAADAWPVTLRVEVEGPPLSEAEAVRLGDPLKEWEATAATWATEDGGRVRLVQEVRLRLSGKQTAVRSLPDVSVRFRDGPGAAWERAEWADLLKETRPPPPPEPLPELPRRDWRGWAVAGAAVVLAGGVAAALLRRRPPAPPPSPETVARDGLAALDMAAADFHDRLDGVVRRYVGARFGLPEERQTTAELLTAAAALPEMAPERLAALRELLERCDAARFAGLTGTEAERADALGLARAVVGEPVAARGANVG